MALDPQLTSVVATAAVGWTMVAAGRSKADAGDEEAAAPVPVVRPNDRRSHLRPARLRRTVR